MDPRSVAGEFLDEHGAGDGAAAFSAADVLDVGERTFDEFAIFVVGGELPHFFTGGFGAGEKFVCPSLIGTKDTNIDIGESDDDGAGERGGVDDVRDAELLGIVDAVGEDEAAFGVGVEDFDGFAGHGGLDVSGLLRFATGHIFGGRNDADYFYVGLESGDGAHDAEHGGTASHVVLHFFHALGRLDGDAAGVEGNGFADEADDGSAGLGIGGSVGDNDNAGRLDAALSDAEKSAHFEISDFLFVEDIDLQAGLLGHGFGFFGEDLGGEFIGRLVDEVAREILGFGDDSAGGNSLLRGGFFRVRVACDGE